MNNIFKIFSKYKISEPPWDYDFLYNLPKSEYAKYLKKIFKYRTGKNLNLKNPKTFNEKIQWIKIYGITPLMRDCTDKVKVRDFIREKIGAEYLKPVLQIIPNYHCNDINDVSTYFDQINFEKLPNSFVIKCNHGCKWHYIVENKNDFLSNNQLFNTVKQNITGWLEEEFWCYEGFEMQYKGIVPKLLIEPYMLEAVCKVPESIEIFCFSGMPKIFVDIQIKDKHKICVYNEDFSYSDLVLRPQGKKLITEIPAGDLLKQAVKLSRTLSKEFKFVRVDYMIYKNKLYFEELTFTPYSGFTDFNKKWDLKLGNWIKI